MSFFSRHFLTLATNVAMLPLPLAAERAMPYRYDETAFVYGAPKVLGMAVFVEMHVVTEPEDEEAYGDNRANHDYP